MTKRHGDFDAIVDRNLRSAARHVSLPGEPTPDQKQSWTSGVPRTARSPLEKGLTFMRKHKAITVAGTGSLLAASIATAAILLIPTSASTVSASTIFASLHDTVSSAFRMTLKDLGVQNIHVDGEVVVVFDDTDGEPDEKISGASAMYFDMRVHTDDTTSALAGLDFVERGGFGAEDNWVYAKVNEIPKALLDVNAAAAAFAERAQGGVLLELGVLNDVLEAHAAELARHNGSDQAAQRLSMLAGLMDASGKLPGAFSVIGLSGDAEVNTLLTDLVSGRADPEDFNRFATLLEETAGYVDVTPQNDGTYLLQAGDFTFEGANSLPGANALLGRMTLEIAYDPNTGLLWAVVDHIGTHDGSARFERSPVQANDPMFSNERYRRDGRTTVLDESIIATMLGIQNDDHE